MDDQFTEWHSVRPWHPSLSLYVREITSVSVTFILSSPYSSNDSANAELASLGLSSSDDDDQSRDSASTADTAQNQVLPDLLAKGLSVKVNGTPWQRVILKMDDVLDEAIIILYGLMPARQYDIELGILPGEASVRSQITTDNDGRADTALPEPLPEESVAGSPDSSSIPLSSSPSHISGGAHSPNGHTSASPFTLEDRRLQLTHALSLLNTEHSNLTTSLKSARRESQKADAQLRSEIDILKRASDRHAAGENRARKKVLALQEAVKQTLAAARDIEELIKDVEAALPALEVRKSEVEKEWTKVKKEAARVRAKREEAEQREKARAEAMQSDSRRGCGSWRTSASVSRMILTDTKPTLLPSSRKAAPGIENVWVTRALPKAIASLTSAHTVPTLAHILTTSTTTARTHILSIRRSTPRYTSMPCTLANGTRTRTCRTTHTRITTPDRRSRLRIVRG
ncbi:hypothetical protein C8Q80DRAFT_812700 [Daedaleopsis nitida]|nr:hypothetical protein C8Q80DRAFT_812700 [Daedaleopsis nitida]